VKERMERESMKSKPRRSLVRPKYSSGAMICEMVLHNGWFVLYSIRYLRSKCILLCTYEGWEEREKGSAE
jgi:hypothetical protein